MVNDLLKKLKATFCSIPDHRRSNSSYALGDTLMAAFAMFHLKDESLLSFRDKFDSRKENLARVYGVKDICEDTALRKSLDGIETSRLKQCFKILLNEAEEANLLEDKLVLSKYLAISIDGTGYYCSSSKSCKHCLTKKLTSGKQLNHHQLLASSIVHPDQSTVFPVYCEPIVQQDGAQKNDCERNACKRLLPSIRELLPESKFSNIIVLLDGLYADGPTIKALQMQGMNFITTIKEGYVLIQAEALNRKNELKEHQWQQENTICKVKFSENLVLNGANQDILVNYIEFQQIDAKTGKVLYANTWITDLPITVDIIPQLVKLGRARWKIENETFNTLKKQGYHLEHDYGHGENYLCSNFAILMFIAFLLDQIAQAADTTFIKAMKKFKTKKAFWEAIRSIFYTIPIMSMNTIYKIIAKEAILDIQIRE